MTRSVADHSPPAAHPITPDALAVWFAGVHRDRLRYVGAWKRWMAWDGKRWRTDTTLLAPDRARAICGRAAAAARDTEDPPAVRVLERLAGAALPGAVERLARSDRVLAAEPSQWDADPDLLNTPEGILDTRTGALLPHRPDAWMTRMTAVAPAAPGTPHPLWSRVLDRLTQGDAQLAFYLQRVAGYALTGRASEHAAFFLLGAGASGKSTFALTLRRVLGDYAVALPVDALTGPAGRLAKAVERLDGARLALVEDGSDGAGWNAARLKALVGGEPAPRAKLLVAANDWPRPGRVDAAVARRLHPIPLAATIPDAERDTDLPEKLEAEYPAILRWAVDGALAWRRIGLKPPDGLRAARDEHLEDEDTLGQWLEECTERASPARIPSEWVSSAALYASWQSWCRAAGEKPGSRKRFGLLLKARGFVPKRERTGARGFLGPALRDASPEAMMREMVAAMMEQAENASSRVIASATAARTEANARDTAGAAADPGTAGCGAHEARCCGEGQAPRPMSALPHVCPLPLTPSRKGRGDNGNDQRKSDSAENASSRVIAPSLAERTEANAAEPARAKAGWRRAADGAASRASVVPRARWTRMIGRHPPAMAESALLFDSPVLAALVDEQSAT